MVRFLEAWLLTWSCTLSTAFFQAVTGYQVVGFTIPLLVLELASLPLWGLYWTVLYPNYFTPFRNLPTPPKRTFLTGNRTVVLPDYPYEDIRSISAALPNNGLVRFYEPFCREVLLVTKPNTLKEMLTLKAYDFGHPGLVKLLMKRLTGNEFNFLTPFGHKLFRKNLRPAFTNTHVKTFAPIFRDKAAEMVQLIEAELKVDRDAVIDLSDYGNRASLDVLGLAMMGYDFQTLQHPNNEFRNQFRNIAFESNKVFKWMQLISHYIDLRPLLLIFSLIPGKKMQVKESSEFLRNFARKVIEQRREKLQRAESPDIKDITTVALESDAFQSDELADHAVLFLTVGHKSTSAAFEWTMFELGKRPEMQRRLRTDINKTLGSASLGTAELGSRVLETPYLIAVCSEVIRCYPFTPLATKIAEIDTSLLGEHIPKGTAVCFSAEALNHDQELWGPDAHLFNPDRWMTAGMANSGGASSKYAMLSFSAGPWGCIGEHMARAELAYLVAAVVQRFEINLVHPETGGRSKPGPFMRSVDEIQVRLKLVRSS